MATERARRRAAAAGLAGAALLGAALACAAAPGAAPAVHAVAIENMAFQPAALVVRVGDRVQWRNRDLFPHTATAAGVFDSGPIAAGAAWTLTAQRPGVLRYTCSLHPTMSATLTVEERP